MYYEYIAFRVKYLLNRLKFFLIHGSYFMTIIPIPCLEKLHLLCQVLPVKSAKRSLSDQLI